ncbi:helix-turn-helix transcriptional regulator [Ligilactobacillus equi]|uniref:helix-turn-helix domain-containing protein n=1 Tax=Ligilactobacillus equi TaxID=137357 RepID=UPI002ED2B85D
MDYAEHVKSSVAKYLAKHLAESNMTINAMAKDMNAKGYLIRPTTLANYFNGSTMVPGSNALMIADYCGTSVDELLGAYVE